MRKIFITGASSGIGEAMARHYTGQGVQLGLVARRTDFLSRIATELTPPPAVYAIDVRDAAALKNAATDFIARFGVPDIVIANAGVSRGTLTEFDEDLKVFQEVFDINVQGMVNTFHAFLEPMKLARNGTLVGIASVAGFRGIPGGGAYSASKAAAISYCESLRVELRNDGIAVVTICPGYIRTPMTARNSFRMPFLMNVEEAARRTLNGLARGRTRIAYPWPTYAIARLLGALPVGWRNALFSRLPAKSAASAPD